MRPTMPRCALLAGALLAACNAGVAHPSGSAAPATAAGTASATAPDTGRPATPPPALATPIATSLADTAALGLPLPGDSLPIDIAYAFGSIWLVAHHQNQVYRIDPTTMAIEARITVGNGPGWFAVVDDALWVSLQLSRGMSRIDPATNTADARFGQWPPCGSPVVAAGSIWQMACDSHQLMKFDPVAKTVTDLTVTGYQWPAFVDGQLVMVGDGGMARIDQATGAATPIPGAPGGFLMGSDGHDLWVSDEQQVRRVSGTDGRIVATMPITYGGSIRFFGDHAWLIQQSTAAMRVDPATNDVTKTIPILYGPVVALEAAGYLWVPTMDGNMLWRIAL